MSFQAAIVLLGVGLITGWLSGVVMKVGGYGLRADLALGIGGSMAGAALFHLLASSSDTGWFSMIAGAVLGAVLLLVVQRMFWQMPRLPANRNRPSHRRM